ncbi:hypothetical protein GCM10010497_52830 [Streptomyces cinereoruber]|uniref:dTMP kinase n=1 Tax=Streptomyces cinereoruber TaxID=67260 RepID=A0AAV4KT43_9ACTN|nr:hypothetical protein [Streptomyces cinereoruber]MBB4160981.1 hypothetical protein [Streptomyces cinereoruber]MBY8818759.1 hypothetical protein [Streptomyces cinereoruber]NIH62447.1 hypothetical protein [Streptomyces cinereoruber]QEV35311.1 hypothetical protein CP977_26675 [Streptomyces cinereoruber]GGR42884.1 hypothetical protein GCM10010497_52830 [Streptomyces cinereoruber]
MLALRRAQRALIVLVATVPLLLVTLAFLPALLVLPFRRERAAHAQAMVRQLSVWTRVLLLSSRER